MTSCRTVRGPDTAAPGTIRPTEKAARPQPLTSDLRATPGPSKTPSTPSLTPTSKPTSADKTQSPPKPYKVLASQQDPSADALLGPAYADLLSLTIEDDGTNVRITVDMNGNLPPKLSDEETVGVGVNLYATSSQTESDYQVFVDGGSDGWFAYLDTPKGFVDYPGTFQLGGARMVFVLPWASLGGLKGTGFDVFEDWASSELVPKSSYDRAPDNGRTAFSR